MKNKRLALVDKATTAGYIFQQAYFKKQGIDRMAEYFREIHFAGSHDAAAWAVYTGEADVGGAKNHIFNALGKEYPDFYDKMLILARSSDVPSNGMVVRADLDAHLKARLKELLLGLNDSPEGRLVLKEFGAMSFIENRDEDYSSLYKMVAELGLDLATYQY
jgi:phosphonate transport system substrate-binding protein